MEAFVKETHGELLDRLRDEAYLIIDTVMESWESGTDVTIVVLFKRCLELAKRSHELRVKSNASKAKADKLLEQTEAQRAKAQAKAAAAAAAAAEKEAARQEAELERQEVKARKAEERATRLKEEAEREAARAAEAEERKKERAIEEEGRRQARRQAQVLDQAARAVATDGQRPTSTAKAIAGQRLKRASGFMARLGRRSAEEGSSKDTEYIDDSGEYKVGDDSELLQKER